MFFDDGIFQYLPSSNCKMAHVNCACAIFGVPVSTYRTKSLAKKAVTQPDPSCLTLGRISDPSWMTYVTRMCAWIRIRETPSDYVSYRDPNCLTYELCQTALIPIRHKSYRSSSYSASHKPTTPQKAPVRNRIDLCNIVVQHLLFRSLDSPGMPSA